MCRLGENNGEIKDVGLRTWEPRMLVRPGRAIGAMDRHIVLLPRFSNVQLALVVRGMPRHVDSEGAGTGIVCPAVRKKGSEE